MTYKGVFCWDILFLEQVIRYFRSLRMFFIMLDAVCVKYLGANA